MQKLFLTFDAACYMARSHLVMRNSFTEQVRSLHYGFNDFPSTHTAEEGQIGIPLWTVAIPELLDPSLSEHDRMQCQAADNIKAKVTAYISEQDKILPLSIEQSTKQLSELKLVQQKIHLANFLTQIKKHIKPYTSFGTCFKGLFNYELLIATSLMPSLDDYGRYPTGGRSRESFTKETIVYRATFNSFEIEFIKTILRCHYDKLLPKLSHLPQDVADSVRYTVCNQLCTEIIAAKLVIFLNSKGNPCKIISLSKDNLEHLLNKALVTVNNEVNEIIKHQHIVYTRIDHSPKDYILSSKYGKSMQEPQQAVEPQKPGKFFASGLTLYPFASQQGNKKGCAPQSDRRTSPLD